MIAVLLLAGVAATSAIDAEHAFARDAQRIGQWTAFRKWAAPDAVVFTPHPAAAHEALPAKDPPKAIKWAPAHSWVSCDGRTAVNTGPWWKVDDSLGGYFTTVWQRGSSGWRWIYDGGGPARGKAPSTAHPRTYRATCGRKAPGAPAIPPAAATSRDEGRGQSADRTLAWRWKVEKDGARELRVLQWNGIRYAQVLYNDVPAPKPPPAKE